MYSVPVINLDICIVTLIIMCFQVATQVCGTSKTYLRDNNALFSISSGVVTSTGECRKEVMKLVVIKVNVPEVYGGTARRKIFESDQSHSCSCMAGFINLFGLPPCMQYNLSVMS